VLSHLCHAPCLHPAYPACLSCVDYRCAGYRAQNSRASLMRIACTNPNSRMPSNVDVRTCVASASGCGRARPAVSCCWIAKGWSSVVGSVCAYAAPSLPCLVHTQRAACAQATCSCSCSGTRCPG
jgi:hypothetical protein